jgi:steroid delta-isomerase-like uncharacterized protein
MTTEENKNIVRRHLIDVLEQGHVELIESYYTPDGSVPDNDTPKQWKDRVLWHHKNAPGFKITILDMMAEGDKVMVHWQADVTYIARPDPPFSGAFAPLGKAVQWRIVNILRIVNGKLVSSQSVNEWDHMLAENDAFYWQRTEHNKAAVQKFIDGLNRQDAALLAEVCTPAVAKDWTEWLPGMYTSMKDHHIEVVDMTADGASVAVKMATSGYHTGELHGIPATGNHWTNRVYTFFRLEDGKIAEVDALPDVDNFIKQIGGAIGPAAPEGTRS